jgi:hypothetical protein
MDILNHDLETIKALGFRNLDFITKVLYKILVDDAVRAGKEGQDVLNKVTLIVGHLCFPIVLILTQVNLFSGPEGSLSLLIELPNL